MFIGKDNPKAAKPNAHEQHEHGLTPSEPRNFRSEEDHLLSKNLSLAKHTGVQFCVPKTINPTDIKANQEAYAYLTQGEIKEAKKLKESVGAFEQSALPILNNIASTALSLWWTLECQSEVDRTSEKKILTKYKSEQVVGNKKSLIEMSGKEKESFFKGFGAWQKDNKIELSDLPEEISKDVEKYFMQEYKTVKSYSFTPPQFSLNPLSPENQKKLISRFLNQSPGQLVNPNVQPPKYKDWKIPDENFLKALESWRVENKVDAKSLEQFEVSQVGLEFYDKINEKKPEAFTRTAYEVEGSSSARSTESHLDCAASFMVNNKLYIAFNGLNSKEEGVEKDQDQLKQVETELLKLVREDGFNVEEVVVVRREKKDEHAELILLNHLLKNEIMTQEGLQGLNIGVSKQCCINCAKVLNSLKVNYSHIAQPADKPRYYSYPEPFKDYAPPTIP